MLGSALGGAWRQSLLRARFAPACHLGILVSTTVCGLGGAVAGQLLAIPAVGCSCAQHVMWTKPCSLECRPGTTVTGRTLVCRFHA
eukprot:6492247-Amphidinium_carterae.1